MLRVSSKTIFSIKIIITVLIFWMLARHSQLQLSLIYSLFQNPFSILLVFILCYLMVLSNAWRWYRLNTVQHITLSYAHTITPTFLGVAFNYVLPGSIGGDFYRLYLIIKKFPQQKSKAVLSIFVDRICGLLGIFLIACVSSLYYFINFKTNASLFYLLISCIAVCISVFVAFFVFVWLLSEKVGLANWLSNAVRHTRYFKLISSLIEAIQLYKNAKLIILESLIVSMITQILLLFVMLIIGNMMGFAKPPIFDYLIALALAQIANLLPITPGGIGIGEAAFGNIILLLNPATAAPYATAYFAFRVLSTLAYLPGVLIGIFKFPLKYDQEPTQETIS